VEIILPTGGTHRTKAAEDAWKSLLTMMEEKYGLDQKLEVPRGRVLELAEAIQTQKAREIWESDAVFGSDAGWKEILEAAFKNDLDWPQLQRPALSPVVVASALALAPTPRQLLTMPARFGKDSYTDVPAFSVGWPLLSVKPRLDKHGRQRVDLRDFTETLLRVLGGETSEKTIEAWIKKQAWDRMLAKARQDWPKLQDFLLDPANDKDKEAKQQGAQGLKVEVLPDK